MTDKHKQNNVEFIKLILREHDMMCEACKFAEYEDDDYMQCQLHGTLFKNDDFCSRFEQTLSV